MIRLFVGLALPQTHRQHLNIISHGIPGARWVASENLHITLRFIGEVDEDVAEDLAQALSRVSATPFEITLKELGTFGEPPHAIWAGVKDDPDGALAALQANIESALVRKGLEPEHRKYSPHVTLAYCKKSPVNRVAQYLEGGADLNLAPFKVTGFSIFQSHLRPEGAEYSRVVEFDF